MAPDEKPKLYMRSAPINFVFPPHVESRIGNLATVQHTAEGFILSFFEAMIPLIPPGSVEKLKAVPSVDARCVARIQVTPGSIKRLRDTISENIATFEAQYGEITVAANRVAVSIDDHD